MVGNLPYSWNLLLLAKKVVEVGVSLVGTGSTREKGRGGRGWVLARTMAEREGVEREM
jgi:hypothetical protein